MNTVIGTASNPMSPGEARKFVVEACRAGLTPYLIGPPGVGKTEGVRAAGCDMGLELVTMLLAQREPTDMTGIPFVIEDAKGNKRTKFAAPADFPTDRPVMIFLDEFAQAPLETQRAASEILLDHTFGGIALHPDSKVVLASNRKEDRAGAAEVLSHNKSRIVTVHVRADVDGWVDWALEHDIEQPIIAFITLKQLEALMPKIDHKAYSYACPRTWSFVDKAIKGMKNETNMAAAVCGSVGETLGVMFLKFMGEFEGLATIQEICANPDTAKIPKTAENQLQVAYMIICQNESIKRDGGWSAAQEYMGRINADNVRAAMMKFIKEATQSGDQKKIGFISELKSMVASL